MSKILQNILFENVKQSTNDFTKHYHDTYTIGLTYKGVLKSYNSFETYDSYEYSIRINNPGEVHSGKSKEWSHANFYPTVDLLSNLYEQIFYEKKTPFFQRHIVENKLLFLKLHNFFTAYFTKEDEMFVESLLIEALSELILSNTIYTKEYNKIFEDRKLIKNTYELINDSLDTNFTLDALASNVNLSKYHFLRLFKKEFGLTPHAFIINQRLNKANRLIQKGVSISQASVEVGFNDQSHYTRNFKKFFGYTPLTLKKNSNFIL
ncbi:AraC family transcriptional regulator [Arcobacter roscoffensis]|uniref:AraC family transcriptional regulator n=1 Tax=Arcobacter roscoffensis TaxID=2961520 RepID=A0ABY5E845_9BACT|nr:AraC family transcriptional regulator [Arcobacter roscoffensis]UTJ07233.1 AraC family transcriptional regulator [Arcobacter roscoffensis]